MARSWRRSSFLLAFFVAAKLIGTSAQCIDNINFLVQQERAVTDTSVKRSYILCPRVMYFIAQFDISYNYYGTNVMPAIPLRPNLELKCGDDGKRTNLCWLMHGDVHLDGTKVLGVPDERIDNVVLEGFVFISAKKYSLWAMKPGSITFKDCEWRDHSLSVSPVYLDFFDETGSDELVVTFQDCLFANNRFLGWGSNTALVYANSAQNRLRMDRTTFSNNNMVFNNTQVTKSSSLIETLGPLEIENSCFEDNLVGVSSAVVMGSQLTSFSGIHVRNSTGQTCQFASVFETLQQYDAFLPICVSSTESFCRATITPAPTLGFPTPSPSDYPSASPSLRPTPKPSDVPSRSPTRQPSASPTLSHAPSVEGASPFPSASPTPKPSTMPTLFPTPDFNFPSPPGPTSGGQPTSRSQGGDEQDAAESLMLSTSIIFVTMVFVLISMLV